VAPLTKNNKLRPFTRDEVKLYLQWITDLNVVGDYVEIEEHTLADLLSEYDRTKWLGGDATYMIYENSNKEILGYAHWWKCDRYESHLEFGRVLLPEYRGHGLGTTFLREIIDTVFRTRDTLRLQSIAVVDHRVVLDQWSKVGIKIEGRLREFMTLRGMYVDCYIGSILRKEWKKYRK
jgi:RimJ/RimL family protein N-acetyltransferase